MESVELALFRSALGWISVSGRDETVLAVSFGHSSAEGARRRIERDLARKTRRSDWFPELRERLQDFADGAPAEFLDIDIELSKPTPFTRSVVERCRRIPYGETLGYGQLALEVGAPRAARAVGNVMRTNRFPLIVPCHRVVHGDGRIGLFSAPQGACMKERLLAMEAASSLLTR